MSYTKTNWAENTPITTALLNKIETGIANALDATTGGTVNGKLTVKGHIQSDDGNFYSNKNGGNKAVIEVFNGDKNGLAVAYGAGALTVLAGGESGSLVVQNTTNTQESAVVSADQGVILYSNLQNGWENKRTVELAPGGRLKLHNNMIEFSPDNSGYARMGYTADTQDVYISNINNNWFRLRADKTITYAGNKVYTSFDKPTASEVGALALTGGTLTGDLTCNKYLKINAWSGYGSGTANFWFDGNNKTIEIDNASQLKLSGKKVYHEGNTNSPAPGNWFSGGLAKVGTDGVMEVGRYIDFHLKSEDTGDWSTRLEGTEDGRLMIGIRQAAMFEAPNPKHHLIRYGKDLPGLDGFITFSL